MLWVFCIIFTCGILAWLKQAYDDAYSTVEKEKRHKKTKYREVRRILKARTVVPKRYTNLCLAEGQAGTLFYAESLYQKVDESKKPSWTSIVAVAVYMQYHRDCHSYTVNDEEAVERLVSLDIADYKIRKDTQENTEKMIRKITGFF